MRENKNTKPVFLFPTPNYCTKLNPSLILLSYNYKLTTILFLFLFNLYFYVLFLCLSSYVSTIFSYHNCSFIKLFLVPRSSALAANLSPFGGEDPFHSWRDLQMGFPSSSPPALPVPFLERLWVALPRTAAGGGLALPAPAGLFSSPASQPRLSAASQLPELKLSLAAGRLLLRCLPL